MDIDSMPTNTKLMAATRPSQLTSYSFTYNELYELLYLQRDVENVKLDELAAHVTSSLEKKPKNKDTLVSCEPSHHKAESSRKNKELQLSYAISSFPDEVQLCMSSIPCSGYGVSAKQHIPIGTWIGPYEGKRRRPEEVTTETDNSYMWEIFQDGRLVCYLDASDENTSSWMRFIRCARHHDEQNLYAFQYCGNIYYRAFRNIQVGQELLVWYDDKYQHHLGLPLNIQDMAIVDPNGNKLLFDLMACNVKPPINDQHSVTQSTQHLPQSLAAPVTKSIDVDEQTPLLANRYYVTPNVPPLTKTPVQRVAPATQQQSNVTQYQQVLVNCTTKHPIVVTAPVSTVVMETSSKKTKNETTIRKIPINVTQSSFVTQTNFSTKQISPSKRKKLHDQQVSTHEDKHLKVSHDTHAQEGKHIEIPHGTADDSNERTLWNCGQCQRSFTQRALLQIHVCPGMPNRPYKCGHCADSFAMPNDLRTHVVKHTNEKPFKCGFCSRSFAGATTLNNHIRTHTGEKPFTCSKCRKMFSTASQLNRHQKTPTECV